MLGTFFYIFLFFIILYLFFAILGKRIIVYLLTKHIQNIEKKMQKQEEYFQNKYDPNFERELHLSKNVKIQIPYETKKSIRPSKIQDVDFEEIK